MVLPLALIVSADDGASATIASVLDRAGTSSRRIGRVSELLEDTPEAVDLVVAEADAVEAGDLGALSRRVDGAPIVLLGTGGARAALAAIRAGAADFLERPWTPEELLHSIRTVLATAPEEAPVEPVDATRGWSDRVVGQSRALMHVHDLVRRVATGDVTVLVRGESGTGKELVARAIHERSDRATAPFIKVHCAALPETLLESEIFGYERGAFTGATSRKAGRVELAEGGTLFLDEIGDVTPAIQVKLLRLLQDQTYERLGGRDTVRANVRIITATHRDLEQMIREGTYREDLFYRLNVVPIWLPPLRARREDIPVLARHFCSTFAARYRKQVALDEDAVAALTAERWPGNVRQLQNFVERLVVLSEAQAITAPDVARELSPQSGFSTQNVPPRPEPRPAAGAPGAPPTAERVGSLDDAVRAAERQAIERALAHAGGNRTVAARLLGVSRTTLYAKLEEHGFLGER